VEIVEGSKEWLEQRSLEVEYSFRRTIKSDGDLAEVQKAVAQLYDFMNELDRLSQRVQIHSGEILQVLLSHLANRTRSFDSMKGEEGIPMHQAKVLDRTDRLGHVEEKLSGHLGEEEVQGLVSSVNLLRQLLKVKVEDPNDLNMARQAVSDAHRFLEHLTSYAQEKSQTVYESLCKFRA